MGIPYRIVPAVLLCTGNFLNYFARLIMNISVLTIAKEQESEFCTSNETLSRFPRQGSQCLST